MSFAHDIPTPTFLPGAAPTGRAVMLPVVVVMRFEADTIAYERIYRDCRPSAALRKFAKCWTKICRRIRCCTLTNRGPQRRLRQLSGPSYRPRKQASEAT
jgi:hypothetical protein